jgi:hypothetical protein
VWVAVGFDKVVVNSTLLLQPNVLKLVGRPSREARSCEGPAASECLLHNLLHTDLNTLRTTLSSPRTRSQPPSKDRRPINMTANPIRDIRRTRAKEERPLLILLRQLAHLLQIQHLPQRHPPQREDILMQMIALLRGPALKRRSIPRHSSEVAVVQPVDRLLGLLDPGPALDRVARPAVGAEADLCVFLRGALVVIFCEACSDEKNVPNVDIAALGSGPDVDALELADFDEIVV